MIHPKRNSRIVLIVACVAFIIASCRKDEPIPAPGNCYCCAPVDAPDQLEIGNFVGTNVLSPDTIITCPSFSGSQISYEIDVDQDGVNDLQLLVTFDGPGFGTPVSQITLDPLNAETFVQVSAIPDTIYYYEQYTYAGSNPVVQTTEQHKNCTFHSSSDSIIQGSTYLNYYQAGDVINLSQNWTSDTKNLVHYTNSFDTVIDSSDPDTMIVYESHYNRACHDISLGEPTYIGIKKNYCGEEKLGWLKVTHLNTFQLQIHEVVIQK